MARYGHGPAGNRTAAPVYGMRCENGRCASGGGSVVIAIRAGLSLEKLAPELAPNRIKQAGTRRNKEQGEAWKVLEIRTLPDKAVSAGTGPAGSTDRVSADHLAIGGGTRTGSA